MPIELLDISISKPKPKSESRILRSFDDGCIEVRLSNGTLIRQVPSTCSGCGTVKIDNPLHAETTNAASLGLCVPCLRREVEERRLAAIEEKAQRELRGPSGQMRRHIALTLATPLWRDRKKIKKIYDEAKRISARTGVPHHVDHIYPIQSKYGCGLHVHQNLQIIEMTHNCSKKNKFPLFDSPALWTD